MERTWKLLIMGGSVLGMLMFLCLGELTHNPVFEYLAYALMAVILITWSSVRCPRCGKILGRNVFANYCPSCGESLD